MNLVSRNRRSVVWGRQAEYKTQLEGMLATHVAPLFFSAHAHLRAKACWLAGVFADTKFAAGFGAGPVFEGLFQANVNCLSDADMPVRAPHRSLCTANSPSSSCSKKGKVIAVVSLKHPENLLHHQLCLRTAR